MTKEEAWLMYCKITGTKPVNIDYTHRAAFDTVWSTAHTQGWADGVESTKKEPAYDSPQLSPFKYAHVQYGYEFIAYPDGTLTVTPTGANKK